VVELTARRVGRESDVGHGDPREILKRWNAGKKDFRY